METRTGDLCMDSRALRTSRFNSLASTFFCCRFFSSAATHLRHRPSSSRLSRAPQCGATQRLAADVDRVCATTLPSSLDSMTSLQRLGFFDRVGDFLLLSLATLALADLSRLPLCVWTFLPLSLRLTTSDLPRVATRSEVASKPSLNASFFASAFCTFLINCKASNTACNFCGL